MKLSASKLWVLVSTLLATIHLRHLSHSSANRFQSSASYLGIHHRSQKKKRLIARRRGL